MKPHHLATTRSPHTPHHPRQMFNIVIILGLMYIIHFHPYLQYLCNKRAPVILTSMVISMITSLVMYAPTHPLPYTS
jgi:hypothetical protein